ncbi:MAG: cytochrome c [Pseudomonadota bacterium]|jgi:Cytochrome c, mono- and diheme variants|nr:MAG: p-cresol methylhydroxylase [Pseudomonadota bacterium]
MKSAIRTTIAMAALLGAALPAAGAEPEGKEVFDRYCIHCHGPGNETPGTLQLARTRGKELALLTERTDLAPEYIRHVVRHGLRSMPAFVPSELTDAHLEALVRYLTAGR